MVVFVIANQRGRLKIPARRFSPFCHCEPAEGGLAISNFL